MKNLDLSLDGILDSRWNLKEMGNGRIKLEYNSLKGLPSVKETKESIEKVLRAKGLESIYISDSNGEREVTLNQLSDLKNFTGKTKIENQSYKDDDIMAKPFGAEDDLMFKEDRGII